ncbi:MAG: serine hydrolase domain-containing protein [Sporichthyaceae bacterium]|jgi:methyl acetate hydrolase
MSAQLDALLESAVASGAVPNVVAVAADRTGTIYSGSAGPRRVGDDAPVGLDTVFWIASMTKMVTTVAALQLRDAGRLDFDAPVATYLPEWDKLQVLDGFDGDLPRLRAPKSAATVAQLVTHTAGATYWFWNADMVRYESLTGQPNVVSGLAAALQAPLVADPGTRFEYGSNTDFLGRVVEEASGESLPEYFAAHVLGPLGMVDTGFTVREDQRARLVALHVPTENAWQPMDFELPREPEYWSGGHGLYSTAQDYLRFQRMLLGGGVLDAQRIVAEASVREAFANQIGSLAVPEVISTASPMHSADFVAGPDRTWGWGLLVNTRDVAGARAAGSGTWAGLGNTHFWVDPASGVTGAIYSQFFPFVAPDYMKVYAEFEREVYALARG